MRKTKIKRIVTAVLASALMVSTAALFAGCGSTDTGTSGGSTAESSLSGKLTLNGSTSMATVCQALGEVFHEQNPGVTVEKSGTGSGDASKAVLAGTALIGDLSRELKDSENPDQFEKAIYQHEIIANNSGYIGTMNTEECGKAAVLLGAGREVKDDPIDMTAGIKFNKKTGDAVKQGDIVAIAYSSSKEKLQQGVQKISDIYDIVDKRPQVVPEIIGYIE